MELGASAGAQGLLGYPVPLSHTSEGCSELPLTGLGWEPAMGNVLDKALLPRRVLRQIAINHYS